MSAVIIVAFVLILLAPCLLALAYARASRAVPPGPAASSYRTVDNAHQAVDNAHQAVDNAHLALAARARQARSIAKRAAAQWHEALAAADRVHGDSISLSNQVVAAHSRALLAERFAIAAEAAARLAASRAAIECANAAQVRAEAAQQLARQTASDLQSLHFKRARRSAWVDAARESEPKSALDRPRRSAA